MCYMVKNYMHFITTHAQENLIEEPKLLEYLRHKGGVHKWVIWLSVPFILLPIILVIVSIPLLGR